VTQRRKGEPGQAPPPTDSFGDAAGEMGDETFETGADDAPAQPTDLEEPVATRHHDQPHDSDLTDISGIDNMLEEGAPLEPSDLANGAGLGGTDTEPDARAAEQALTERTADLQRLQAEYLNYKRRVDRDRELVRENATYAALAPVVEVLDTIDRAREHGDLEPGLQAVADQLERAVSSAGLVKYGEPGDVFDPRLHEALSHMGEDPEVEVTTAKVIAKAGYRIGDRVVRAAQVLVVDPA
jgi:molecular chaperone GrpE